MTADEIREKLVEAMDLIEQLPSGIDYEADPMDKSPDDMIAHVGGLAWQRLQSCLVRIKTEGITPQASE